jgi:hypothetical protein
MSERTIPLTRGNVAVVDSADYETLIKHKWYSNDSRKNPGKFYAFTKIRCKEFSMHRMLTDAPDGLEVDHINGDTLDNRRANLRLVTRAQNQWNRITRRKKCSSRYLGVYWNKRSKRWRASIRVAGYGRISLGQFQTEDRAAIAYQIAKEQRDSGLPVTTKRRPTALVEHLTKCGVWEGI